MDVWLDTETLLPQRTQVRSMGMLVTLDFDSVEVNPGGISDELFIFRPPPGSMELPTSIPALPGFGGN
jgi:outer membrane lipoprotein-sorting protein